MNIEKETSLFQYEEKATGEDDDEQEEEKPDDNADVDENDNEDERKPKGLLPFYLDVIQIRICFLFRYREKEINR